ncbi:hypothetical protein HYH02_006176 [Chlamydomonas schloesseri]|uniref:Uncharacterized protein n=1 Tax=Chlamydomonas schloesseri TaxID=2026947 RepID=A0A835WJY8_9CHLO|nr:hypothetical protein HYH02_006176 [Chlamydomonas schloesseri]|eukprot:KAG2448825.1 hypothetical protein HYH02_006176 [Chlamydomonas schloesseri]
MASGRQHSSIFDKLTDSSLYTGAHKHRFDANGNGRGLAGRDRVAKGHGLIAGAPGGNVADLSQITRTNLNTSGAGYGSGYIPPPSRGSSSGAPLLYSMDGTRMSPSSGFGAYAPSSTLAPSTPGRASSVGRPMRSSHSGAGYSSNWGASTRGLPVTYTTSSSGQRTSGSGQRTSIFDRLHDPSSYTGAHRQRFSSDGRGRGIEGRTMSNAYISASANVMRR